MKFCDECGSMMTDRGKSADCENCGDREGKEEDIQRPRFRNCDECGEIMTEAGKHWRCKNCDNLRMKVEYL